MNQDALDALRREVIDAVYGQDQWLEAVTVALPPSEDAKTWVTHVGAMLADLQLDGVDVSIEPGATEAPWLRSHELKPGWA